MSNNTIRWSSILKDMKRLSYLLRETKGRVFRDDEFATHLKRVAVSEDDLPADGFFAIGAGGPPDASRRVEDFVGPAIDRRHPTSVSTSEDERDAVRERPYAPAGSRLSFIGIGRSGLRDTARSTEEILAREWGDAWRRSGSR